MYLYSNILGTFVFNQNFQIREKILSTEKDILKNNLQLIEKEPTDIEKTFMERFKNIKNIRLEPDEKAQEKIDAVLNDFIEDYYELNMLLTKLQIRNSVADDLLIVQASSGVQELGKAINLLSKRLLIPLWSSQTKSSNNDALIIHPPCQILTTSDKLIFHSFLLLTSLINDNHWL